MLQALIFDVDGTLADTERDGHRIAFNRAFAEAGLDWEWTVERYGELLETRAASSNAVTFSGVVVVAIASLTPACRAS